jgi:2-polyprenyl-3-methyl-5-hydroxy-6-metoxy-1,4-benzoquinol methylase
MTPGPASSAARKRPPTEAARRLTPVSSLSSIDAASEGGALADASSYRQLLRRIIAAYDSIVVRAYCIARFQIINLNMLHILSMCLRGKRKVLEVGCGFGLFGCYFAARDRRVQWNGLDLNSNRVDMARKAASRLGLSNARFAVADARNHLELHERFDAVVMMDLLHHIPDESKRQLLETVLDRLAPDGVLIIKDVMRRPRWKLAFTWLLDVGMTRGFDMWYWDPGQLRQAIDDRFDIESYPISDWLPYPHIVYVVSRASSSPEAASRTIEPESGVRRVPSLRDAE